RPPLHIGRVLPRRPGGGRAPVAGCPRAAARRPPRRVRYPECEPTSPARRRRCAAMNCNECGKANRAEARFCGGCGRPLAARCPQCGADSTPDAQFCDACGASLVARAPEDAGARKVVTIVFADLVGSTALHERLDAESAGALMDRYYRPLRAVVAAHGGRVVHLIGDGD